jgi:hypothetical protein
VVTRQQQAIALLRSAGWQVAAVRPDQGISEVWGRLGGSGGDLGAVGQVSA